MTCQRIGVYTEAGPEVVAGQKGVSGKRSALGTPIMLQERACPPEAWELQLVPIRWYCGLGPIALTQSSVITAAPLARC